jgi:hypothetical protein
MTLRFRDIWGFAKQHTRRVVENPTCVRHRSDTAAAGMRRKVAIFILGPILFAGIFMSSGMLTTVATAEEIAYTVTGAGDTEKLTLVTAARDQGINAGTRHQNSSGSELSGPPPANTVKSKMLPDDDTDEWSFQPIGPKTSIGFALRPGVPLMIGPGAGAVSDKSAAGLMPKSENSSCDLIEFETRHRLASEWILLASVVWPYQTGRNALAEEKVPDAAVPVIWNDSTHYILGLMFVPAAQWKVSAELAVDHDYLGSKVQGNDKEDHGHGYSLAAGLAYQLKDNVCLNLVYTHLPAKDLSAGSSRAASTNETNAVTADNGQKDINLISAAFSIHF